MIVVHVAAVKNTRSVVHKRNHIEFMIVITTPALINRENNGKENTTNHLP